MQLRNAAELPDTLNLQIYKKVSKLLEHKSCQPLHKSARMRQSQQDRDNNKELE